MILVFWMLSFKPTFSLSSFTLIERFFSSSSSSLSAIRAVSSAYLRLLIFLPAMLGDTWVDYLDLGIHSTAHIYIRSTHCILNIYKYIYQLFLNGVKKKETRDIIPLTIHNEKENRLGPRRVRWMETEWWTFRVFNPKYITHPSQSHTTSISNFKGSSNYKSLTYW